MKYITKIHKNRHNDVYDIIIPAAGMGRRMKSYGPKALLPIDNKTSILSRQLEMIKTIFPHSNVIVVCGFEANKLMKACPDNTIQIENENHEQCNVVRSIGMGLRACTTDNVVIIYGDLVFNYRALEVLNVQRSSLLTGKKVMKEEEVGCVVNEQQEIEHMMYGLPIRWGQIGFFTSKELAMLKRICWNSENYRMFGFEAINQIISARGKFKSCENDEVKVIDVDSLKDMSKVHEYFFPK